MVVIGEPVREPLLGGAPPPSLLLDGGTKSSETCALSTAKSFGCAAMNARSGALLTDVMRPKCCLSSERSLVSVAVWRIAAPSRSETTRSSRSLSPAGSTASEGHACVGT